MAVQADRHFELHKGVKPGDPFHATQSRNIGIWERYMRAVGLVYQIDHSIPYDLGITIHNDDSAAEQDKKRKKLKEHFNNSSVFLAKLMTGIYRLHPDGTEEKIQSYPAPTDGKSIAIACAYQDLRVHYATENGGAFRLTGLAGDIQSPLVKTDVKYLNRVLIENMRGALILAHNAKLAGWTTVNFGKTSDPCRRLALQIACEIVGLDCASEEVDLSALPQDTLHGKDIAQWARDVLSVFEESPMEYYGFAGLEKPVQQVVLSDDDLNDGLLFDDEPPARTPTQPAPQPEI